MFVFAFSPVSEKIFKPKTYDPIRKGDRVFFQERTSDLNDGLLYSDFSTKSLLDAEAVDLLRPLSPMSASRLAALDSSMSSISNLSKVLDSIPVDKPNE